MSDRAGDPGDVDDVGVDATAVAATGQPPPGSLRESRGSAIGAAVGGFMGSIEQQVFRRQPPAVEVVRQAAPVRGTTGAGLEITLELPLDPDR